ncbi:MAG: response regulator [Deferribacteres bacterium]|nr:response regulator [candidate division KSB1 bacterium]MCB9511083.1 response regulator [Deferribacteres bacterium]
MVAILVVLTIVVFIVVDFSMRMLMKKIETSKLKKEREQALDIGLRLDFTDEAKSLKRVHVDHPKAKILAVDDEEIVLDSFRKILVLAGYSIDTVEAGKEALGLVQKNDYDFVFTDLKMPEMNGIEVTKAVKHLRPDIDVIVITGYATIESAVETMKYGATDYVQKPFTEDELVDFINKSLIRRQDRMERLIKPKVHLITPTSGESHSKREFNVPAGVFIAPTHTWANIEMNGSIRIGLDDFAQKILGQVDEIELPQKGEAVSKGGPLFTIRKGSRRITIPSPVSGKVTSLNEDLVSRPELLKMKPYELGWMCCIEPSNLADDLKNLRIGAEALNWYQQEIEKYNQMVQKISIESKEHITREGNGKLAEATLDAFSKSFLNAA